MYIFIYIRLYINFMVTTNQKSMINTDTAKRKESNVILKIVIKSQGKATKEEERNKKNFLKNRKKLAKC